MVQFTDQTSSCAFAKNPANNARHSSWSTRHSPGTMETPVCRGQLSSVNRSALADNISAGSSKTVLPTTPCAQPKSRSKSQSCSPKQESVSPTISHKDIIVHSPRSTI